jgi:hypothetical protein
VYAVCVIEAAAVVGFAPNPVALNVGLQLMHALLLPLVLGFLVRLDTPPLQSVRLVSLNRAGHLHNHLRPRRLRRAKRDFLRPGGCPLVDRNKFLALISE